MDRGTLESIVKPWWLTPPAFLVVMILLTGATAGYVGTVWCLDQFFLEWVRAGW